MKPKPFKSAQVKAIRFSQERASSTVLPLLEKFKEEDNRSTNPNKVSYNRMLLISRIVYFFGYTDNPKFLDNDESISGIWTSYKDKEWTTVGANFR